jgi:hypothetical protein
VFVGFAVALKMSCVVTAVTAHLQLAMSVSNLSLMLQPFTGEGRSGCDPRLGLAGCSPDPGFCSGIYRGLAFGGEACLSLCDVCGILDDYT